VLRPDGESVTQRTTIFGPTCDSLDCILKKKQYPALEVGEWLFVPDFGAYTVAAGAPFNGFATRRTKYVGSLPIAMD
jgi:ornithine decarboxylase